MHGLALWIPSCPIFSLPTRKQRRQLFPLLGVGWTSNFEMLFYMLFAVALFLRVSVFRFVGTALFLLAAGAIFRQNDWPAFSFYLSPIVLDFFFGMLVAKACLRGSISRVVPRFCQHSSACFYFSFFLLRSGTRPSLALLPQWSLGGLEDLKRGLNGFPDGSYI